MGALALPPGAKLVEDEPTGMKLPPGAKLVGPSTTLKMGQDATGRPMGDWERMGNTLLGAGKGLLHTASDIGVMTGLQSKETAERAAKKGITSPTNPSQSAGFQGEQLMEYMVPLGEEKLIAGIPKGLQWLSRAGLNAARVGTTAAIQSGDVKAGGTPAAVAAGTTLLFGALAPVMSKLGSKIQFSTIKPSKFDVADGFSTTTLEKYGIKGNLEQSFNQVDKTLTELRNTRNALIAPGKSHVDLQTVFGDAIAEAKRNAGKLKYGPAGHDLVKQIEAWRDSTFAQLGIPKGWAGKVSADVRVAENLKEYLGTMGAWANGGSAADKLTEEAANSLYARVKNGIETSLGPQGPKVKALNDEMRKLIPVRNAIFKRIPVEQRRSLITLSDLAATLPAVISGDARYLTIEGLKRAQQSLRVGNALVNAAPKAASTGAVAGKVAGAAAARLEPPEQP